MEEQEATDATRVSPEEAGSAPRTSRRTMIAGMGGALAAILGAELIQAPQARAADHYPMVLGESNEADGKTTLKRDNGDLLDPYALSVENPSGTAIDATGGAIGVSAKGLDGVQAYGTEVGVYARGNRGILAQSAGGSFNAPDAPGVAIHGYADKDTSSIGVKGESTLGTGVLGANASTTHAAVQGENSGTGPGVVGSSEGTGPGVSGTSEAGDGVLGFGGVAIGAGVHGKSGNPNGGGVLGENLGSGYGVRGSSATGDGVKGFSASGDGVVGQSSGAGAGIHALKGLGRDATGPALQVDGTAAFARSGIVSIPAQQGSVTVMGVSLSPASIVLALTQNASGGDVSRCIPNVAQSSFVIRLKKAVHQQTVVGWFVVN